MNINHFKLNQKHQKHHAPSILQVAKDIFSPTAENNAPLQSLSKDKKNLQSNRHLQI
jgi:hypothetical protein